MEFLAAGLETWCGTVSRHSQPQLDDYEEQEAKPGFCSTLHRSLRTSYVCGGDAFELFHKGSSGKTKKKIGRLNSKDMAARESNLVLDLPGLTESYRILKGQSMGILKLAIHQESHQRRAVFTLPKKSIIQAIPPGSNDREEVMTHLQKLLKIDHVNVLALHEACEDQKNVYLMYDWPEGGLLLRHLTTYAEGVTEAHVASVIRETLAGVAAASRFGVYHHDWSLMCLFLGYKNRFSPIKVFGIGLAGVLLPLVTTRKESRSNKHFYASPELIEEHYKNMTFKKLHGCDVWSVGTLLYMLFSGRPPFYGGFDETVERIKKRHWSFGPEFDLISKEAKDIIDKMLDKDWERRPSANELLKHPFLGLEVGKKKQGGVVTQDVLSKLDQFARETHCKQTLARLLADLGLQESAYTDLEERFRQLDLDGNGVVEISELEELSGKLSSNIDGNMIASIIQACDRNDNGTIDISEFVSAVVLELESKDERLLVKAFDKMDVNKDARITKGEIFRVLRQYSGTLETSDVSNFVADMDKDTDQKIDFNEFKMLFPHMREKDEEIKSRIRSIQLEKESKRKSWNSLMNSLDKFLKALRSATGKLMIEHMKLQKIGMNERQIQAKVKSYEKVLTDFVGSGKTEAENANKAETREKKSSLTGLTVMNMYNKEPTAITHEVTTTSAEPLKEMQAAAKSESPPMSAARSAGNLSGRGHQGNLSGRGGAVGNSGRGGGNSPTTPGSPTAQGRGKEQERTVAHHYVLRSIKAATADPECYSQAELKRRRRYIWLGAGEGIKHVRSHIYGLPIKGKEEAAPGTSPRSDVSSPRSNTSSPRSRSPGGGAGSGGSGGNSPGSARTLAQRTGAAARSPMSPLGGMFQKKAFGAAGGNAEEEEEEGLEPITAWSSSKKNMKNAKLAMELASGAVESNIGSLHPYDAHQIMKRISQGLLQSSHFKYEISYLSDDLADLSKVLKFKCLRSWLPPVILLQQEMKRSMDETKIHVMERRSTHLNGIRLLTQLTERIFFSISEFIMWQEEGIQATFSLEEVCPVPPATKRFLPFRNGEVDDDARTPRDEEDAADLAGEAGMGEEAAPAQMGAGHRTTVSFAEGELAASAGASQALQESAGQSQGQSQSAFMTQSMTKRLDRTAVRSRTPKGKGKGKPKAESRGEGKGEKRKSSKQASQADMTASHMSAS